MADFLTHESCQPVWNAPSITVQGCSAHAEQPSHAPDAIAYAEQMGRLDVVSLFLAGLGLAILIATGIAYVEFRVRVTKVAKKTAIEVARATARNEAIAETRRIVPPEARRVFAEWQAEFGDTFRQSGGNEQDLQNALESDSEPDDPAGA